MQIKNLSNTPIETIVASMLEAFEGYFVIMPEEVSYWRDRYAGARVRYDLSFGAFENDRLVAFIINGVDYVKGKKTAYNTGTGVIPEFRGNRLIDQLYEAAIPEMKKDGIDRGQLEVICANGPAINVYERIGFSSTRVLKCYKGKTIPSDREIILKEMPFDDIKEDNPLHSWDNMNEAILFSSSVYSCYQASLSDGEVIGSFVINPSNNYVAQINSKQEHFGIMLEAINQVAVEIRMNNQDASWEVRIQNLNKYGFENSIDQFEMEMHW